MHKFLLSSIIVIALMFVVSIYFFPLLPEKIATHWNAFGQPDGYSEKGFGTIILPVIVLIVFVFLVLVPKIDPLKKNIQLFYNEYLGFVFVFCIFFLALQLISIAFNLGFPVDIRLGVVPGIALLFAYLGYLLPRTKRNYFIGIRTPWTLASDSVWEKTHRAGGKVFYALAIFSLLSAILPGAFILFFIVPLIAAVVFLFAYSYLEFQKEERGTAK